MSNSRHPAKLARTAAPGRYPLVPIKMHPPPPGPELVERPRLLRRIPQLREARVTLILAPAGFGKTSLLLQFFHALRGEGVATAWLATDPFDQDPFRFLTHAASSLTAAGIVGAMEISERTPPHALAQSIAASGRDARPAFLFIDDAHHLTDSPSLPCLGTLLDCAPAEWHFVIAARALPDFPVARLRAHGKLLELGTHDLRFDESEISALLARTGHAKVDAEDLRLLETRTEGWAVGIKLFGMALSHEADLRQALCSFSGRRRHVADFFAEDVLSQQPPELQSFLLHTAILERLCPDLCDAVTDGTQARHWLSQCEQRGLFLTSLDEERTWYRYHPLFADFLRRELTERDPQLLRDLHCRASEWLDGAGFYLEAFEHALQAQDAHRAAMILNARCDAMFGSRDERMIAELAARIPPAIQARYPRILLAVAWDALIGARFSAAEELLSAVRNSIAQLRAEGTLSPAEFASLQRRQTHREMLLSMVRGEGSATESKCRELIERYDDDDAYMQGTIYSALISACHDQYKFDDLHSQDALVRKHLGHSGTPFGLIVHDTIFASALVACGQLNTAMDILHRSLDQATAFAGPGSPLGGGLAFRLADLYYERNEIEAASGLMTEYEALLPQAGILDKDYPGWITRARLARVRGNATAALEMLEEAAEFAARHDLHRLRLSAGAEQISTLASLGDQAACTRVAREINVLSLSTHVVPAGRFTVDHELRAFAWLRFAETQSRVPEAIRVARQWRHFLASTRACRALVRWEALLARLLLLDGQHRAAERMLRSAISNATRMRMMRTFLDEGPAIGSLLLKVLQNGLTPREQSAGFIQKLAEAFECERGTVVQSIGATPPEAEPATRVGGPLSWRELEILRMVAEGMLNREIGSKLGITEGSVKWYMQRIYDKVGVRRRSQAVQKVKHLGLIPQPRT